MGLRRISSFIDANVFVSCNLRYELYFSVVFVSSLCCFFAVRS